MANYSFTNHITGGKNITGLVTGGQIVQGDFHNYANLSEPKKTDAGEKKECYALTTEPKGHMFIIANEKYDQGEPNIGVRVDQRKLETLGEMLHYDVESSHKNLTAEEMRKELKDFVAKFETEPHVDSAIVFILSRGNAHEIIGTDGVGVKRQEFVDAFKSNKCGALTDKPKLFFFDVCKENKLDPKAQNIEGPYSPNDRDAALAKNEPENEEGEPKGSRPSSPAPQSATMSDMLIVDAVAMDYYAFGGKNGSLFIESIYEIFKSKYETKTIDEMLQMIHEHGLKNIQGRKTDKGPFGVEGTNYASSLTKTFMFCPPAED
uniref:Caspase family p20 domain-containing protein n=1 Tax=Plectus sambesii TaxID=2011161 RepID=A0A914XEQ8_9BILA